MRKENVNLIMLLCLLLSFCSGFASCGGDDEEEDDMWVSTEVLPLDKKDTRFSEAQTIFNCVDAWGSFGQYETDGKVLLTIHAGKTEEQDIIFYPVGISEDVMCSKIGDQIKFNGAVKVKPDSLDYNPIVLTYAKAHFRYPMPTPVE